MLVPLNYEYRTDHHRQTIKNLFLQSKQLIRVSIYFGGLLFQD